MMLTTYEVDFDILTIMESKEYESFIIDGIAVVL